MSETNGKTNDPPLIDPVRTAVYWVLGGISMLCVLLVFVRIVRLDSESFRFMLWNLFLAWLPLIVSMIAIRSARGIRGIRGIVQSVWVAALGIGWLLLYPNAPYLTTDFIHLIFRPYRVDSLLVWYDLVVFFLFSWCGLLLGYVSMRHFHVIVSHYISPAAGWLFVTGASFLGGFGIYLGRVVRLNSWDALFNPFRLIAGILEGLNKQAFIFTCLFGLLSVILYVSLYALRREQQAS
jgi:uncharacterized membrane protein